MGRAVLGSKGRPGLAHILDVALKSHGAFGAWVQSVTEERFPGGAAVLILGLRDKAAPPTSQQINKFPPKRVKNLATPSSIFIFVFSSSTGELCSQPIRGNDRRIGRMFPEYVGRRFLDPEYSFDEYFQLDSRRKVGPIQNQLASPNTSN